MRKEVGCFPARIRRMISVKPATADKMIEPTCIKYVESNSASSPSFSRMNSSIIAFIVLQNQKHCKPLLLFRAAKAIRLRGDALLFFEHLTEIFLVMEADHFCYFGNTQIRIDHQLLCLIDSHA